MALTSRSAILYSIEVTQNGRSGVWRVTHPDGTVKDARFEFTQDAERGALVLSSSALPHEVYESPVFTSSLSSSLGW